MSKEALTITAAAGAAASAPANNGDTANADAAAVAAANATITRPAWLPEGFNSGEELAKGFSELKGSQVDFAAIEKEFSEKGVISEDTFKRVEKTLPRKFIESYVAGQQAAAELLTLQVHTTAGGMEAYQEMLKWAATNLPPADAAAFDAAVTSGDGEQTLVAVRSLKAHYDSRFGTQPKTLGGNQGGGGEQGFGSFAEVRAAINDPRYASSDAYRKSIAARIQASNPSVIAE